MRFLSSAVTAAVLMSVAPVASAETASTTLVVAATFNSRTSLNVSTDVLQFNANGPGDVALAMVDFSAGARTAAGAQVVLSLEPVQEVHDTHGPADADSLTFSGVGEGTLSGTVAQSGLTAVGRWTGSGLRHGRLIFALRKPATGTYTVPVRFVLSAP